MHTGTPVGQGTAERHFLPPLQLEIPPSAQHTPEQEIFPSLEVPKGRSLQ